MAGLFDLDRIDDFPAHAPGIEPRQFERAREAPGMGRENTAVTASHDDLAPTDRLSGNRDDGTDQIRMKPMNRPATAYKRIGSSRRLFKRATNAFGL